MAHIGYDSAYAAAKRKQLEEQLAEAKDNVKRISEQIKQYPTAKTGD